MSYRTYVNGVQIFGNNDYFEEWEEFIKSKGIEIDEDGCYDGEIDDVMSMFEVIDKITRRLINERHQKVLNKETNFRGKPLRELTDFSDSIWLDDKISIFMFNQRTIEDTYCFLPYQVYLSVKDIIEELDKPYANNGIYYGGFSYKLKDGKKIEVHAS